jgi:hypothetical protein
MHNQLLLHVRNISAGNPCLLEHVAEQGGQSACCSTTMAAFQWNQYEHQAQLDFPQTPFSKFKKELTASTNCESSKFELQDSVRQAARYLFQSIIENRDPYELTSFTRFLS